MFPITLFDKNTQLSLWKTEDWRLDELHKLVVFSLIHYHLGYPAYVENTLFPLWVLKELWRNQLLRDLLDSILCYKHFLFHQFLLYFFFFNFSLYLSTYLSLTLGEHNIHYRSPNEQRFDIAELIMHPRYDTTTTNNDMVLLRLKTKASYTNYIRPACFPDSATRFSSGEECYVTGWGYLQANGASPRVCDA